MKADDEVSLDLARALERCEIEEWEDIYRAATTKSAAACGVSLRREGSAAIFSASGLNALALNRVVGLGLGETATDAALERIIEHFAHAGVLRFFVQRCPVPTTDDLHHLLIRRGFRLYNHWVKLHRGVEAPRACVTDLRLECIDARHAEAFGEIVATSFEWPPCTAPWVARTVGRAGWRHYMAFDGDTPVATGALFAMGGLGGLNFGCTLPESRGRGAQGALIARRIHDAATLGCTRLVAETADDTPERSSPSYRNMLRFGFEVAYHRPNYLYNLLENQAK